uniref:Thioredoxin domain-containing protein n=1 Tax=viral metagenome TaxID=1070528 RepID=A0A6C0HHH9_9ZZZZ
MKFISITPENVSEYTKIVEKQRMPSFVKLYKPSCGHCQMMQPAWDALKTNDDISNIDIAIIEVNEDALQTIQHDTTKNFQGYPTIRLVIDGKIKKEYEGDRSTNDMVNFIKDNLNKNNQKGGTKRSSNTKRSIKKRSIKKRSIKKRSIKKRSTKKRSTKKRSTKK